MRCSHILGPETISHVGVVNGKTLVVGPGPTVTAASH